MDYWDNHGLIFLVCITFFPRWTMLFATATPFGVLAWLGWIFCPHLLAAIFATTLYWDTNPILVVFSWMIAIGGTMGEGKAVHSKLS